MNEAAIAAAALAADREDEFAPLEMAGAAQAIERLLERGEGGEMDEEIPRPGRLGAPGEADGAALPDGGESGEPRLRVRIGGAEREMALSDIVALYQQRNGAAAPAVDASALSAPQSRQAAQAGQLATLVPALRQQLQAFAGTDWARVAAEDPALYAQARPAYEALAARLGQSEATQAQLAGQQQRARQALTAAHARHLAAERDAFVRKVPELADARTARREMAALSSYLGAAGYQPHEMDGLVDHRDLILARKAMLYDRLMEGRGQLAQTMQALPRMQPPGMPAERGDRGAERRATLMRRLQRSGRTEDAARLIEDLI